MKIFIAAIFLFLLLFFYGRVLLENIKHNRSCLFKHIKVAHENSFFKDRSLKTNNFDSLINNDYAMMLSDYIDFYKDVE